MSKSIQNHCGGKGIVAGADGKISIGTDKKISPGADKKMPPRADHKMAPGADRNLPARADKKTPFKTGKNNPARGAKKIDVKEGEKVFVGVDVHKNSYRVAVWSEERQTLVSTSCQPADGAALIARLDPIRMNVAKVFYEAGPAGFGLARQLMESGFAVEVVSPAHTPRPAVAHAKTDRIDCRELARLGAKGQLHPVRIPTLQEEQDRQWVRLREQRLERLQIIKIQIKSFLLYSGIAEPPGLKSWSAKAIAALRQLALAPKTRRCLDLMLDDLGRATAALAEAAGDIRVLSCSETFAHPVALCRTIPGEEGRVGVLTAMIVLTEMIDAHRFTSAVQVSNYQGLAPGVESSGEKTRHTGLMKCGNPRLRRVLIEAAWQWVRRDPAASERYLRLIGRLRARQKAIVAMARRLGIILWRMLTRDEPYRRAAVPAAGAQSPAAA